MATATLAPPPQPQRFVLEGVSWQSYENLLHDLDGRAIRLTFDQGVLEIMTLSYEHEHLAELFARFILILTEELNLPIQSGGSTTFRKEAKARGLEPDKCYWIQHETSMRGKREFDIDTDPPPDLALEIDITRSSLNRLAIYADLGILEVWRFDGETVTVYHRTEAGKMEVADHSLALPKCPFAEIGRFLTQSAEVDETTLSRSFRAWVRKALKGKGKSKRRGGPRKK